MHVLLLLFHVCLCYVYGMTSYLLFPLFSFMFASVCMHVYFHDIVQQQSTVITSHICMPVSSLYQKASARSLLK